jgi:SAM-dependent methyltransferase
VNQLSQETVQGLVEKLAHEMTEAMSRNSAPILETIIGQLVGQTAEAVTSNLAGYLVPLVDQAVERTAKQVIDRIYYISWLPKLLDSTVGRTPHELFAGVADDYWLWLNTEGYRMSPELRQVLPGLPQTKDLENTVSAWRGDETLTHGFHSCQVYKEIYKEHKGNLTNSDVVLDFGCGWGRVLRFFLKDIKPSGLWGVDPWPELIEAAKQSDKWCHYEVINPLPPMPFEAAKFDLVFCCSVFSHLSEEVHLKWLPELARVLKPGGLLIATTMPREQIEWAAMLHKQPPPPDTDPQVLESLKSAATLFPNAQEALADYDSGKYCRGVYPDYCVAGQPWGDTCIPKAYILDHWSKHFMVLDYIDDRTVDEQNIIVARKAGVIDEAKLRDLQKISITRIVARKAGVTGEAKADQKVETFAKALTEGDAAARQNAAGALEELGAEAKAAVPALIRALQDPDPKVRSGAASALWAIGCDARESVPALIAALRDPEASVRLCAAGALGGIGPDARYAVPALQQLLNDSKDVRVAARNALEEIEPNP